MDFISREAALDCISSQECFYASVKCPLNKGTCDAIRSGLSEIPADDVKPVRYACNDKLVGNDFKCSACGKIMHDCCHGLGYHGPEPDFNYCPYCGALIVNRYRGKEKWKPWEGKGT